MDERVGGGGEEVAGTACLVDVVAWLLYFTCLVCDLMWLSQILHILKCLAHTLHRNFFEATIDARNFCYFMKNYLDFEISAYLFIIIESTVM